MPFKGKFNVVKANVLGLLNTEGEFGDSGGWLSARQILARLPAGITNIESLRVSLSRWKNGVMS